MSGPTPRAQPMQHESGRREPYFGRRVGLWATLGCLVIAGVLTLTWRTAVSMPDAVRIPIVKPHPQGAPPDAALFRHGRHDQFDCSTCHPSLFPMWKAGFTHAEMDEGRFCATCHDGIAASDVHGADCRSCHVPR